MFVFCVPRPLPSGLTSFSPFMSNISSATFATSVLAIRKFISGYEICTGISLRSKILPAFYTSRTITRGAIFQSTPRESPPPVRFPISCRWTKRFQQQQLVFKV